MLFTESELSSTNVWNLLENANYLDDSESLINPKTIPVKENSRLGYGIVRFDDVERLSESQGCDYIDAMYMIAEASEMNPEYLAVAVPEEDVIAYPELVNELANIVIQPLSEDSFAYQYVDMCLEAWDNTEDEGYLDAIIDDTCLEEAAHLLIEAEAESKKDEPGFFSRQFNKVKDFYGQLGHDYNVGRVADASSYITKGLPVGQGNLTHKIASKMVDRMDTMGNKWAGVKTAVSNNKAAAASLAVGAGAAGYGVYRFAKWVKQARNKPKSWIGQKIAALRGIYQKWMQAAQRNPAKAGMIKSACAKIMSIIDALLARLQSAAG